MEGSLLTADHFRLIRAYVQNFVKNPIICRGYYFSPLKVLTSEMDPAEIRLIR
jgi:hypothetical protein